MGLILGQETKDGFEPSWIHKWLQPEESGNDINGLGEPEERLPTPVYHRMDRKHPYWALQISFYLRQWFHYKQHAQLRRASRYNKNQPEYNTDVAPVCKADTPENWTLRVRNKAMEHEHCDLVGITELNPELYFDWDYNANEKIPAWAIVITKRMDYEIHSENAIEQDWTRTPFWKTKFVKPNLEVIKTYADSLQAAYDLAAWIREQGYPAECVGGAPGSKINILKAAIEAGLGELGKHGSIINDQYGSAVRFSVVLTDMPLVKDEPREFGADDFCTNCRLCTANCPPDAIFDTKQLVRGVEKWYVDFDKCVPYFNETHGCAICISVCPWSRPGVAPTLAKKMLRRKQKRETEENK